MPEGRPDPLRLLPGRRASIGHGSLASGAYKGDDLGTGEVGVVDAGPPSHLSYLLGSEGHFNRTLRARGKLTGAGVGLIEIFRYPDAGNIERVAGGIGYREALWFAGLSYYGAKEELRRLLIDRSGSAAQPGGMRAARVAIPDDEIAPSHASQSGGEGNGNLAIGPWL